MLTLVPDLKFVDIRELLVTVINTNRTKDREFLVLIINTN